MLVVTWTLCVLMVSDASKYHGNSWRRRETEDGRCQACCLSSVRSQDVNPNLGALRPRVPIQGKPEHSENATTCRARDWLEQDVFGTSLFHKVPPTMSSNCYHFTIPSTILCSLHLSI